MNTQEIKQLFMVVFFLLAQSCQLEKKEEKMNQVAIEDVSATQLTGINPYSLASKVYFISPSDSAEHWCNEYEPRNSWDVAMKVYARPNPFRNDSLDNNSFSTELAQLMKETKQTELVSRKAILQSKAPTDKPLLIEGEIFSSLYEGYTKCYSIDTAYCLKKQAKLPFIFENTHYKEKWMDTIVLVYENNSWKFHDVLYGRKSQYSALQQRLKDFIQTGKEEQRQLQKK